LLEGQPITRLSSEQRIRRGLAYLTESRREDGLLMESPVAANLGLVWLPRFSRSSLRFIDERRLRERTAQVADAVRLRCANIETQPVKNLSGGNQQRTVLGKWLLSQPVAFILDEPTRGVDVGAKYEIYRIINQLAGRGVGLLVISSEIEELMGICDRILAMGKGEIRAEFRRPEFDREEILRAALGESVPK